MIKKMFVCFMGVAFNLILCSILVYASSGAAVTGVSISETALTLEVGEMKHLTATIKPSNAENKNLEWSTSDRRIAQVDSSGLVMAFRPGTCVITVRAEDGMFLDTVNVSVTEKIIHVDRILFRESNHVMSVGDAYKVEYSFFPDDATNQTVKWQTSNAAIATVSNDGVVTAKAIGICKINGTTTDFERTASVTITVNPPPVYPFIDISSSAYKTEISALYDLGIVQGSNEKYRPSDFVTRAELATVLTKAFNLPSGSTSSKFSDVPRFSWYFNSVTAVENRNILYGYPDGTFRPSGTVSLEEAVAVLSRLFVSDESLRGGIVSNKNFTCSNWANGYVDYAVKGNLVDLAKISVFNRSAKREEIAYVIYNALKEKGIIQSD